MSTKRWTALLSTALLALALTAIGVAAPDGTRSTKIAAKLNVRQEVPKPSAASGAGGFTATISGGRLTWKLTFSKLTGPATGGAHIHLAPRGKANPKPAIALCGPCRSGQTGTSVVPKAVERAIASGRAYVNVHTKKNPNGEIRGQISVA